MHASAPGPLNLITDIAGLRVGNADEREIKTGVTVLVCDRPVTASFEVMGGGPGTRDTELLRPENLIESVDAIALSGGSAFGLDAAGGVQAALREMGRGFPVGDHNIPIVPSAILFDLINGGNKDWGQYPPYRELGYSAVLDAAVDFEIGTSGAGVGATSATSKGGLGSASSVCRGDDGDEITIGALVAVNALGSALIGDSGHFWAAPFELSAEFGGLGLPSPFPENSQDLRIKHRNAIQSGANTTIAIVATDAKLTKAQTKRLAIAAHDGFARAIWPSHTPIDGDLIFALSTGENPAEFSLDRQIDMSAIAASTMSRAIARAIYEATTQKGDMLPTWRQQFGHLTANGETD